jgi:hypothetical protein
VLEDLVLKIESITGVKKFSSGQPLQYIISPSGLISDLVKFLPKLMAIFEQVNVEQCAFACTLITLDHAIKNA